MANTTIGVANPVYIDTASATALVISGWFTCNSITWVNDETAGDDIQAADFFQLTDAAGNIIVSKTAAFAGDDMHIPMYGIKINGLICTDIDGGIAYVNVKSYEGS